MLYISTFKILTIALPILAVIIIGLIARRMKRKEDLTGYIERMKRKYKDHDDGKNA